MEGKMNIGDMNIEEDKKRVRREKKDRIDLDEYKPMKEEDFRMIERFDEEQIENEIQGKMIEQMFYSFDSGGRKVIGISYAGVKTIAMKKGSFETKDLRVIDGGNEWCAVVVIEDKVRKLSLPGGASQMKEMVLRDGSKVRDNFAFAKAISKATRNALRALIPEEYIKQLYRIYLRNKKEDIGLNKEIV